MDSEIGSFFKLLEVGFSPYLSFYSHLNVLLMFRLNEAVRGRLIGPKTWDRIDRIFERKMEQPVTAPRLFRGCLGVILCNLCIRCFLGMHWAGNDRGLRELSRDFSGIVNEGFTIPKIVFSKYIFVKICVWTSDLN